MLGLQKNLKEQQKFIQNSQNQLQVFHNNKLNSIQQQQFKQIAELHAISNDIFLLQEEIHKKQQFLRQISNKLKTYYDFKAKQRHLQIKQQAVQNDLEQMITYQERIKKQLRLLSEEEQIMKGKMIVQHNKIVETKQEYNNQTKRKQLLNKHLEDIKKGSENLRRKIKTLKQDFKKVNVRKSKVEENSLNSQVNKLANIVENKMKKLKGILEQKQKHISLQQYSQLLSKLQLLKQQCKVEEKIVDVYDQLMQQKNQLEQRISFLKGVDRQFIDEKKSFIQKLSQKYIILESQRLIQSAELAKYEEQLLLIEENRKESNKILQFSESSIIENQQKSTLGHSKKMSKRKREAKSKQNKEQNLRNKVPLYQEKQVQLQQKTVNRWKGKTLRKHCMVLMTVVGIVGLLVGSVASLYS